MKENKKLTPIEKKTLEGIGEYLLIHRFSFYILFILSAIVGLVIALPYFNLFISPIMGLAFIYFCAIFLLHLKGKIQLGVALLMLPVVCFFALFRKTTTVNSLGDVTFFFFVLSVIFLLYDERKS